VQVFFVVGGGRGVDAVFNSPDCSRWRGVRGRRCPESFFSLAAPSDWGEQLKKLLKKKFESAMGGGRGALDLRGGVGLSSPVAFKRQSGSGYFSVVVGRVSQFVGFDATCGMET